MFRIDTFRQSIWSIRALGAATITLAAMGIAGCGSGGTASTGNSNPSLNADNLTAQQRTVVNNYEAQRVKTEAIIAEVEKANVLQLNSDGTVSLKPANQRAVAISSDAITFTQQVTSGLNQQVEAGNVRVTSDFQVIPTGMNLTSGNQQGFIAWRWWGFTWGLNQTNTNRLIAALGLGGAGCAGTLTGATYGLSAPVAGVICALPAFYVAWVDAPGQGIFINVTWNPAWSWLSSQH